MDEVLFTHDRCHVFRLPPSNFLISEQWEGNHIWTGVVKVVRAGPGGECSIVLEEPTGEVFGACPLKDDAAFQQATDSSRCFVIRVEHGAMHAYLGLNFEHKPDAFRFSTTVVERNKHAKPAERLAESGRALKQEERIQIDIGGKLKSASGNAVLASVPCLTLQQPPRTNTGASRRIGAQQLEQSSERVLSVPPQACPSASPGPSVPPPAGRDAEGQVEKGLDALFGAMPSSVPALAAAPAPKKSTLDDLFS